MHELRGVELRLERADEHVDALKHESRMFQMELPQAYGIDPPEATEGGEYIVRGRVLRPPPVRLGILAIDAAHTMRAALDMIAWQLALKGKDPPPDDDRQVGFPICTYPDAWKSDSTQNMIKRIDDADAIEAINALQPYHRPGEEPWRLLALIQALDNWGKHKAIPDLMSFRLSRVTVVSASWEISTFQEGAFEDGDEIYRVRRVEPIPEPDESFKARVICHIGFSKEGPGEGAVIADLDHTVKFLAGGVLPKFEEFFP